MKEARARRDLIAGETREGRNPADLLKAMVEKPQQPPTLSAWFERFIESRVDVGAKTTELYGNARDRIVPHLAIAIRTRSRPRTLLTLSRRTATWLGLASEIQVDVGAGVRLRRRRTEPGPLVEGEAAVTGVSEEIAPPSQDDWNLIKTMIAKKLSLPLRLIEALGLRVSECLLLTYGDVDFANGRVRVSKSRTKSAAGQRWLAVPECCSTRSTD